MKIKDKSMKNQRKSEKIKENLIKSKKSAKIQNMKTSENQKLNYDTQRKLSNIKDE